MKEIPFESATSKWNTCAYYMERKDVFLIQSTTNEFKIFQRVRGC